MKTQATPRPWKLILPIVEEEGEETEEGGIIGIIMGDRITSPGNYTVGNEIKLDENCLPGENEVAEANAKLIVKAVNMHEELTSLLNEAFEEYIKPFHKQETFNGLWFRIEQALAKAGGGNENA